MRIWELVTGDDQKLSLSKVQMVLWTGLYFTYSAVYMVKTGLPPEFNPSAFILMGISGATYLGTKAVRAVSVARAASRAQGAKPPPNGKSG